MDVFNRCGKNNIEFGTQLKSFIKKHIRDSDVDDVFQEVLIKIFKNINSLKDNEKCDAWVYRIARNTITDHYRKKKEKTVNSDLIQNLPDKASDDKSFSSEEIKKALTPFIEALPEKYKEAIYVVDYQGITQTEYAKKNDLSISGAKSRVQRARKLLKQHLYNCCDFNLDSYGNVVNFKRKNQKK
ncbi:MAG: RNA polymerase sigma factor SigZ [Deltaproteobacteria bacterium]|nr:RNA polymerase sigma factor SigZ [Deltaproteobacteria bacterium]